MAEAGPGLEYFFRHSYSPKQLADFGDGVLALEFSTRLPLGDFLEIRMKLRRLAKCRDCTTDR